MPEQQPGSAPPRRVESEESQLWRWALLLLILLATAVAALSWEQLKSLPYLLGAIPIGLFVLSVLFATYAFGRRREVSDLKSLLKNLQDRGDVPSEQQLDQLSQMIMRSQRSFKELIDSMDDAAIAVALDGTLRTVNRRVSELIGLPYQQIVGHKIEEFLSAPARAERDVSMATFLEKRHWTGVIEVRFKNQPRPRYFECVINGIVRGEQVTGASVLARDITDEREKEQRFTELFETLQEGVYFCAPDGKMLDVNPALVRMLGYLSKDELMAVPPQELTVSDSKGPVLGHGGGTSDELRTREVVLRRKDGSLATCLDSSRAVWNSDGQIVRYQGTLVDVTETRSMEARLRQQEEFRRQLLESFPDLILVLDLNQHYTFVNERVREILGYTPEQYLGKRIDEPEDTPQEFVALYNAVASGKQNLTSAEFGVKHRDGSRRTMRGTAAVLSDAAGKQVGVIISARDITLERKLEQQIVQSERLAAMGQMIGGFAHELNNPLTGILGMTELLQDTTTEESARKQLTMLQQQARRAAEIVQNLMYFARPPAPGRSAVNLNELIERTVHLQAYPLRKANITVDFLPEPNLPTVMADPNQLMQVFLNLILNAEQAIRESREKGTLRIRVGKQGNSVCVTFQDDGPGISPENLPHIFDPFYTTKRPGRGTGLGLSICKTVLREHQGAIEAAQGPGGGAVFTITLPIAAADGAVASK
jgi:two-component system NtrC family sensor kinase